jgi:hypothetical protein
MRKIRSGLAVAAIAAVLGGASLAALAQGGGPGGYGPGGYGPGGYGPGGGGPMGFMHGQGGYGMMGGGGPNGGYGMMGGRGGYGAVDPAARLAALKTELGIRPEQTAAWDGYAKAVQDRVTQMQALRASVDVDKLRAMSWQEHQAFMGSMHDSQAESFKAVQAAAEKLLAALDDGQKGKIVLPRLLHAGAGGGPMGGGFGMMGGPGGGWH